MRKYIIDNVKMRKTDEENSNEENSAKESYSEE